MVFEVRRTAADTIFGEPDRHQPMVRVEPSATSLLIRWPQNTLVSQLTNWQSGLRLLNRSGDDWVDTSVYQHTWLDLFTGWENEVTDWLGTIPIDLLSITSHFGHYRLPLLQLASRYSEVSDLLRSTPALMIIWFDYCKDHQYSEAQLAEGVCQSQRDLLRSMRMLDRKSTIKMLRKVSLSRLNRHDCQRLRKVGRSEIILNKLFHVQHINEKYLSLVTRMPLFAGSRLLWVLSQEINDPCQRSGISSLIEDCIRMEGDVALDRLLKLNSLEAVTRYHNRLVDRFNRYYVGASVNGNVNFPDPPFDKYDSISPITTSKMLRDLGVDMRHCIGSYVDRVLDGEYYVYQMNLPEMVTIGFKRDRNGRFQLDEIKAYGNQAPSSAARKIVDDWVSRL